MKKTAFLLGLLFVALCSCSDTGEFGIEEAEVSDVGTDMYKISKEDAIHIANSFLGKTTRSTSLFQVDYVLDDTPNITRSTAFRNDTLAYILNKADGDGFVIVSTDNRVFPVLAYSEKGTFSYEKSDDDIVYANFVSLLDDYMANIQESDTTVVMPDDYLDGCTGVDLGMATTWNQRSPFDKYVIQEHPGCPVGCVAVATGQIMVYCGYTLDYHDMTFYLNSIHRAFQEKKANSKGRRVVGVGPTYTYEEAVDYAAKLLYFIGKDVNMNYNPGGSGAYSGNAHSLLKRLNFKIKESGLTAYSDTAIAQSLSEGNIIYLRGRNIVSGRGHAWVVDGCTYCWQNPYTQTGIQNVFLHCAWGWGDDSDGYFSGEVFDVGPSKKYGEMSYFSVK